VPESIRLHCFPTDDRAFRHRAAETLGSLIRRERGDGELAAEFETLMRNEFPACKVRSRDPLAALWPEGSLWYVYRDGNALAGLGPTTEEQGAGDGQSIAEINQEP
jgi:hypothetical protein